MKRFLIPARLLLAACATGSAGLALAAESAEAPGQHVSVALGDAFASQRATVLDEMRPGGRYAEITQDAREEVLTALQDMQEVLEGRGRIEDLSPEERVVVFNAQSVVNTRLTFAAEQSREECRRERKVGTHFRTTVCNTVAEWTRQLEDSQDEIRLKQRGTRCTQNGAPSLCGGG